MRFAPIPIVGGSYADDALPFSAQDTVNYLPVNAELEGSRSKSMLKTPPGLQDFANIGTKHRGARNVEGKYIGVSGTTAFWLKPNGSVQILGTVPGTGRVSISNNRIIGGNQVKFVNGSAGYIWNSVTGVFARITDPAYPGEIITKFIGQRFIGIESQRLKFLNSELADGLEYNGLDTYEGESAPDLLVTLEPIHGEVVVFSDRTTEHFAYTGTTNALFQNKIITIDLGCASAHCVGNLDNRLFFVGSDGSGYFLNGYTPERITTHAIEQAWARCDLSKCFAFTWEDQGHKVWYVTFPDGHTWGYDCATRLWHRRQSYGLDRWRLSTLVKWNGAWYGGDQYSGRIFRLNWDYIMEGLDPLVGERVGGVGHDNQNILTVHALELVFDTGTPETVPGSVLPLAFDPAQQVVDGLTIGGSLPDMAVGDVVNFQYATVGGMGVVTFAIDGALPAGLSFSNGHITGTCTIAEHDNSWSVVASDEGDGEAELDDTAYVMDMLGDPPNVDSGDAYDYALTGSEGEGPYTFEVTTGTLPDAITLGSDGDFDGTAGDPASETFNVTMTDANGVTQTKTYTLNVRDSSATTLLPTIRDAYDWNDNEASLYNPATTWGNAFGGGAVLSYAAGLFGKRATLGVQSYVNPYGLGSYVAASDHFYYAELVYIDTGTNGVELIGFSESSASAVYNCLEVTVSGGSASVRFRTLDASDPMQPYIYTPAVVVAAGNHLFIPTYDATARCWTLFHNNTTVGQTPAYYTGGSPYQMGRWKHCLDPYLGVAFGAMPRVQRDESFCGYGLVITTAIRDYLYNSGSFKSYAQIVADNA